MKIHTVKIKLSLIGYLKKGKFYYNYLYIIYLRASHGGFTPTVLATPGVGPNRHQSARTVLPMQGVNQHILGGRQRNNGRGQAQA